MWAIVTLEFVDVRVLVEIIITVCRELFVVVFSTYLQDVDTNVRYS